MAKSKGRIQLEVYQLLQSDFTLANTVIAERVGCHRDTVRKYRKLFQAEQIDKVDADKYGDTTFEVYIDDFAANVVGVEYDSQKDTFKIHARSVEIHSQMSIFGVDELDDEN